MAKKRSKKVIRDAKPKSTSKEIPANLLPQRTAEPVKVIFNDEMKRTYDGFVNFASHLGMNNDNMLSQGFYAFNLITRNRIQLEAAYRGNWLVGNMIEAIPEDMTKAGIEITTNEAEEDIKDIQSALRRLSIFPSLKNLASWGRLYGGAMAVLQIDGQDMSTPLNADRISIGQFKGLTVYDRWQLNPSMTDFIQDGPEIGLPKFYQIVNNPADMSGTLGVSGGQVVHHSRVIRYIGVQLPYWQAVTEMLWGESILEQMWDRLISFDTTTLNVANLVERANNRTVGIENLREIVAAGGKAQAGLEAQMDMMRAFQANEGMTLIDKEDTFTTTNYTFAGLSDVLLQFIQQLSGASKTPLVRLLGQSPAGLNATGEADLRTYYDNINSQQEAKFGHGLDLILRVMWRSVYGKPAPKDLEFTFVPLWQMPATDKATVAKTNAETILAVHEDGLISSATALKELRHKSKETGMFTNISDEDVNNADQDPPEPDKEDPKQPPEQDPKKAKDTWEKIRSWLKR